MCPGDSCGKLVALTAAGQTDENNFDDKMADIIIGEAVTALLDDNVAISWAALNDRLQAMLDLETDSDRIRAVLRVIEDVRRKWR